MIRVKVRNTLDSRLKRRKQEEDSGKMIELKVPGTCLPISRITVIPESVCYNYFGTLETVE